MSALAARAQQFDLTLAHAVFCGLCVLFDRMVGGDRLIFSARFFTDSGVQSITTDSLGAQSRTLRHLLKETAALLSGESDGITAKSDIDFQSDPPDIDGSHVGHGVSLTFDTRIGLLRFSAHSDLLRYRTLSELIDEALADAAADDERPFGSLTQASAADVSRLSKWEVGREREILDNDFNWINHLSQYGSQPALLSSAGAITYEELSEKLRRVIWALRRQSIGAGDRVVFSVHRRPEYVIAILATLSIGAVFVPVDPENPVDVRDEIVRRLNCRLLITEEVEPDGNQDAPHIGLDALFDVDEGDLPNGGTLAPSEWAYILFTSGSSGRPKGVPITRGALSNYLEYAARYYFDHEGGTALATSIGFDLTLTSLLSPLLRGRSIRTFTEPHGVIDIARANDDYAMLKLTPSHLSFIDQLGLLESLCERTGCFVIGGEKLNGELVARLFDAKTDISVFNEYGPTEATVGAAVKHLTSKPAKDEIISIGRPIDNFICRVVGDDGKRLPAGWTGELAIAGAGVGKGYFDEPSETSKRYRRDPVDGRTFYHTGDRVRWTANGELEFLGRADEQIKVRGVRIETEAICSALRKQSGVKDAAVAAMTGPDGADRLIAYVVPELDGQTISTRTLLSELRRVLPAWHTPDECRRIDALPLTSNGKLDREALASCAVAEPAARLDLDEIRNIFRNAIEKSDLDDDSPFFELGLTSFQLVQITQNLNERFALRLKPADIFQHPTIASLFEFLRSPEAKADDQALARARSNASRRELLLKAMRSERPTR